MKLIFEMKGNYFTFRFFSKVTLCERRLWKAEYWNLAAHFKQSLLKSSLLSNDIVLSLQWDGDLSNNTVTKSESMSDILSDWSSAGIVLEGVTTDYMRPKRFCDFSRTVLTFSPNLQSPYWHFWHHLLEILTSSQLSGLYKTPAHHSTSHISVLNKRYRCQNWQCSTEGSALGYGELYRCKQSEVMSYFIFLSHAKKPRYHVGGPANSWFYQSARVYLFKSDI